MPQMFRDVVVLLPGFIGSVLSKDDQPLWGTSPGALWGVIAGNSLRLLELAGTDNGDEDLGDGIVATGLVSNAEIIPGLWKQGGYSRLSQALVEQLALTPEENFFHFPYDWRRDNRVSARRLMTLAEAWLMRWREKSGNPDAKLIFVAHSMGGLVARYYIECLEGWRHTRLLVTFGTPFRGSGNALDFLANGFKWKVGPLSLFDGTRALRSFQSVYQLLPIYPFIHDGSQLRRPAEIDVPNLDRMRSQAALAFHREMESAHAQNVANAGYGASGFMFRSVVGVAQSTTQSARLTADGIEPSQLYEDKPLMGDGTVPMVSAIPVDESEGIATYIAATHSALQSVLQGHDHLVAVLGATEINFDRFRKDLPGTAISLDLPDVFDAADDVCLRLRAGGGQQAFLGLVERLDAPAMALKPTLVRDAGDAYEAWLKLPPGLYRLSVSAPAYQPVDDIFLVAGEAVSS